MIYQGQENHGADPRRPCGIGVAESFGERAVGSGSPGAKDKFCVEVLPGPQAFPRKDSPQKRGTREVGN